MIGAVDARAPLPWLGAQGWYALLVDVFALLVLVGVITAFVIRKVQRPARFRGSHLGAADLILGLIAGIVVSLFLWHSSQIALGWNDYPASWAPISSAIASVLPRAALPYLERVAVWAHVLIILSFLVYLPYSKHLHILVAAVNVYFGRTRARGRLEPINFEVPEQEVRFGSATATDMTWKQMLDTVSCTECGRCQEVCPAYATGKALSPKLLIMAMRDNLLSGATTPIVPNAVTDDIVWDCVTCGACVRECPVNIEHIDHIIDLRRNLVMVESRFPEEAGAMLRDVDRTANPWGKPQADRMPWGEGLGVRVLQAGEGAPEVLFWVGCAPAFDERARHNDVRSAARALAAAVGKPVEMARSRERTFCCGAGGARMWMEEKRGRPINQERVREAAATGAETLAVACPFCTVMLDDGVRETGANLQVFDLATLLHEAVERQRNVRLSDT